jgi:tellurite resistance protein
MLTQSAQPTRGKVVEEAFFYKVDRELIELLSERLQREEKIRLLANATGIRDQRRLELLADSGFELSTLHFIWVPLILVAWADGNAEKIEKQAIADILGSKGISQETISRVIAHDWFRKKPTEELWEIWAEFSAAASASLNRSIYNELIDEIVRLCRLVADASGGFMGLGKISTTETQAIDRVIRTLQQTDADRTHAESSSVAAQALSSDRKGVVGPCLTKEPT